MRKSVFVLAVIGAACSSVAFAAEVKNDKAHVPAAKATTMSDSDMDKVTAGANGGNTHINNLTGDHDETFSSAQSILSANAQNKQDHFTGNPAK